MGVGAGGGGYRCVPLFQHHERPQSSLRHRSPALRVSQGSWRRPLQRGETYYYAEGMFLFKRKGGREGGGRGGGGRRPALSDRRGGGERNAPPRRCSCVRLGVVGSPPAAVDMGAAGDASSGAPPPRPAAGDAAGPCGRPGPAAGDAAARTSSSLRSRSQRCCTYLFKASMRYGGS